MSLKASFCCVSLLLGVCSLQSQSFNQRFLDFTIIYHLFNYCAKKYHYFNTL